MPEKYLKTSYIAKQVGVHPNTVRLYEQWGLLMPVQRNSKGYRQYTDQHLEQMRLARIAFRCEFIAGNIRALATDIVRTSASGNFEDALNLARGYLEHIRKERRKAEEAVELLLKAGRSRKQQINQGAQQDNQGTQQINQVTQQITQQPIHHEPQQIKQIPPIILKRKEAAQIIGVSIDVLRNWERNGLLDIGRGANGYRSYTVKDIERMKLIYTLRSANYSMMAILRMLSRFDMGRLEDIEAMKREKADEDIRYATDRWLAVLIETEKDAAELIIQIHRMIEKFKPSTISPELLS